MLEWKVVTGDEKLLEMIDSMKERFDVWFRECWEGRCSREIMLSQESPLPHVYHLMCLPFEEVKSLHPEYSTEQCSDCGKKTDIWLETDFSFCDEYGCGMVLCPECAKKLNKSIEELERRDYHE